MKSTKIAISLPVPLLARIEASRCEASETRSAFFRLAADRLLRERAMADRVAEYVAGYVREPEGPGEVEAADASVAEALAGEKWE